METCVQLSYRVNEAMKHVGLSIASPHGHPYVHRTRWKVN